MDTQQSKIPFNLGQEPVNHVDGFVWGRELKRYIRFCSDHCGRTPRELAQFCGYEKLEKFQRRRLIWNAIQQPVPTVYLRGIAVDLDILGTCVGLDQREYDCFLAIPLDPEYVTIKLLPGVYAQRKLCPNTCEGEAIWYMKHLVEEHNYLSCAVHWPGLKSIWVKVGAEPVYRYLHGFNSWVSLNMRTWRTKARFMRNYSNNSSTRHSDWFVDRACGSGAALAGGFR